MNCPICDRELIDGPSIDKHHLIPKTFGGTEQIILHKICHRKIHAVWTERELLKYYNTVDRILENELIQSFRKWVRKKHPEFYDNHEDSTRRKNKRRR